MVKRLLRRTAYLRTMAPGPRRVLLLSLVLLPLTAVVLRLRGIAPFRSLMSAQPRSPATLTEAEIEAWADAVNRAARSHPVPISCLARSLLLKALLNRRGVGTQLRLGVRRDGMALEAHAWLECGGRPVNDRREFVARYEPFDDLPAAPTPRAG